MLAAPIVPTNLPAPSRVTTLLSLLHERFERVVIDAPGSWDAGCAIAVQTSDITWLILAPEVGSLQSAIGVLRALKAAAIPDERIQLIANQIMPKPGLALPSVEKALGHSFKGALPYDEAQASAIGQGVPLTIGQPNSPFAAALKQLIG